MRSGKLVKVLLVFVVGFTSILALSCGDDGAAPVNECALGTDDCDKHATCTDTPEGFTCACNPPWEGDGKTCTLIEVLIFSDADDTFADEAVTAFGLTSIYTTDGTDFNDAYDAGGFGLIIWDSPANYLPAGCETRIAAWVDSGERLIFSYWDLDGDESPHSLQSVLGVTVVSYNTWRDVYPNPGAPGTFFGGVPPPLTGSDDWADNGDELTLTGDGFIAARLGSTGGPGAIAVTNGGKVIVNGFLPSDCGADDNDDDGTPDMQEIYWNQIAYLTGVSKRFFAVYGAASGGDPWRQDVRDKIASIGLSVDVYDTSTTPTLIELQSYEGVLVFSDSSEPWNGTAMGNVLADYLDTGGGVVVCTFAYNTSSLGISGRLESGGYLPFTRGSQDENNPLTLMADRPDHPILINVDSFDGGDSSYHARVGLPLRSLLVAHWNNGYPLVATRRSGAGRITGLNFYPPSSDVRSDFWDSSTDGDWLMANSLLWVSGGAISSAFSEDFESGADDWTTELYDDATDDLWHVTGPNTNSPTQSMWCGDEGSGDYDTGNRINTAVISPSIDLTSLTGDLFLDFRESYDTEGGWDYCMVDISTDGGENWTLLRGYASGGGGGTAPSGDSGGWIRTKIILSDYVGNTVNIRFYFDTCDDEANANPGWFVDDIIVYSIE